tara:strand:+ start:59002 stop:59136 length:135 start_codon:yes stop_codon:yes gene_type:complete
MIIKILVIAAIFVAVVLALTGLLKLASKGKTPFKLFEDNPFKKK